MPSTDLSRAKSHLRRPSSLLHLGLLLLGAAIGGASAGAEPSPRRGSGGSSADTRGVELELKERTAGGTTSTLRATLGSAINAPVQLALETGEVFYNLKLRRDHDSVLHLDLERSQRGSGGHKVQLKLQASAALAAGKRALLARMTRPDGGGLEITAVLR